LLAGDPVDEIEADVVKTGITKMVERAADAVGARATVEHAEQELVEALRAERDARHAACAEERCELRRDGFGIGLDRHFLGRWKGGQEPSQLTRLRERRRTAS